MKERSFARRPSFLRREGGLRAPRQDAALVNRFPTRGVAKWLMANSLT